MYSSKEEAAKLGKLGEDCVAQYLKERGYIIVKRNWRDSRYGEIDIVAENRECVAFVEVKTRREKALVSGAEAIDVYKMRRIKNASIMFMNRFNTDLPARIDVAEVTAYDAGEGNLKLVVNYIESAF